MSNLKLLRLQHLDSLTTFPDVSVAPNINKLVVKDCRNLVEVHESLGSHKRIFFLNITGCAQLKRLPSRFEMESLRYLKLIKCSKLERFPDVSPCMVNLSYVSLDCCSSIEEMPSSIRYLSSLRHLNLRRYKSLVNVSTQNSVNLNTLTDWCFLRTLYLSCRPMESEVFIKYLHVFSSLETLDLSGNSNLIQLPESITCLSGLRKLNLNNCHQLQILHALPSSVQVLEANNCYSLEKIDCLLKEYVCDSLHHISFINCQKLVKYEVNERYLDKMLQQLFLKRCVVADHELRIGIPGNRIPSWFKEEEPRYKMTLKIPPECNTRISGIVICGVFPGEWQRQHYGPNFSVAFKKDGETIRHRNEVDCIKDCEAKNNGNTWISYKPLSSFTGFQREGWCGLGISISTRHREKAVRCAARLIYKEDME